MDVMNEENEKIEKTKHMILGKILFSISGFSFFMMLTTGTLVSVMKSAFLGILLTAFLCVSKKGAKLCNLKIKPVYWILGAGVAASGGINFYSSWFTWGASAKVAAISKLLHLDADVILLILTVTGVLLAMPLLSSVFSCLVESAGSCIREHIKTDATSLKGKSLSARKSFFALLGIYLLGIIAILRANFYYIDDLGRACEGYKGWGNYSRLLSNFFSTAVHMDNYLTDVSPLPQLLAVAIMAAAGILLLVILYEHTRFTLWELLALVPLCLNPYFLECLSFKYDAPYMALSVFAGIFPLLYRKRSAASYMTATVLGTLVMCTTYQASSGIYPMLVVLLTLLMWRQKVALRKIGGFCIQSLMGYGIGILIFKLFIMIPQDSYVSNSLPDLKKFFPNTFENLAHYYSLVCTDFKWWWLVLIVLIAAAFIGVMSHSSQQSCIKCSLAAILTLLLMGLLCFGLYPVLEKPHFLPRTMYGFGIFITLLMVTVVKETASGVFRAPIMLLSWTFFVFAFTYGNALDVQKEYSDFRITQVIEDLNDMKLFTKGQPVMVQITGNAGYAPSIRNMPQNYQILNRLLSMENCFGETDLWGKKLDAAGTYRFYNWYNLKNVVQDEDVDLRTYQLPVLEEHMYHTIRGRDSYILIELKE